MDKHLAILALFSAGAILPAGQAQAATSTAPLEVMATVASTCQVDVGTIDFGVYDGGVINTSSNLDVTCNNGVPYQVGLNAGLNSDGANRMMSDGQGNSLPYRLTYIGAEWGDDGVTDTYPGAAVASTGTGSVETYTVDAMVFADQPAPAGVYSDTVTVTVAF